jgi:molybdopterin molybdotransferase
MMNQGFLKTLSRPEFQALLQTFSCTGTEIVPFHRARNRVLAENLVAPEDLPTGPRSSMDGYALRAADSFAPAAPPACCIAPGSQRFPDFTWRQPVPGSHRWLSRRGPTAC